LALWAAQTNWLALLDQRRHQPMWKDSSPRLAAVPRLIRLPLRLLPSLLALQLPPLLVDSFRQLAGLLHLTRLMRLSLQQALVRVA
jgi:hypothetical protein